MHSKPPSFGHRTSLRQPTLIRRLSGRAEPPPLVSHAAAAVHVSTLARAAEGPAEPSPEEAALATPAAAGGAAAPAPAMALPHTAAAPDRGAESRWARRTPSRLGAQIQHSSLASAIPCTVRDTSSTGARLEVMVQRGGAISRDRVPDQFTLFMPLDRLEIDCHVMWRQGLQLGIRYTSPARRTAKQQPLQKPQLPKKPHTSLLNLLINPL